MAHGLFSLCCVFQMDTTQESYLDLFPLDAIVYLTPDSENGKCFTCLKGMEAKIDPLDVIFRSFSCITWFSSNHSLFLTTRGRLLLDLVLSVLLHQSVLGRNEVLCEGCIHLQQTQCKNSLDACRLLSCRQRSGDMVVVYVV